MFSKLSFLFMLLGPGFAFGQCGSSMAKLTVTILYDSKPAETSVELTDTTTDAVTTIGADAPVANDIVKIDECLDVGTLYKIAFKDSGGDGLAGPNYASFSINDRVIASISDFGSEAVYYFSADGQECGDARWILDIKYDTSPGAITASMTGASGALVFSLDGLNLAFLASQFIAIDRCLPDASYSFSITAPTGFGPGFYRVFFESEILAMGGGVNGFTGTVSTNFVIVSSTPAPSPAPVAPTPPTPEICDDAWEEMYLDPEGATQNCIYLSSRPQLIETHCKADLTSPSAFELCKETCGRCADTCEDKEGKFELEGVKGRSCEYVRVRLSFKYDFFFPLFCAVNTTAYNNCPESCNVCDSIIEGTEDEVDTEDDSARVDPCVDSETIKIWINGDGGVTGEKSCDWLMTNPEFQEEYCEKNHHSNAYDVCAGTCGKCPE